MLAIGALALVDRVFPPDFSRMEDVSTVVRDRDGAPLRFFMTKDEKWRLATGPQDVDPLYLAMLKAYEDKRFDRHFG
ncbi:MAG: penicillin-binding protein 1C, partial [Alphaproteobacteria bacterium]